LCNCSPHRRRFAAFPALLERRLFPRSGHAIWGGQKERTYDDSRSRFDAKRAVAAARCAIDVHLDDSPSPSQLSDGVSHRVLDWIARVALRVARIATTVDTRSKSLQRQLFRRAIQVAILNLEIFPTRRACDMAEGIRSPYKIFSGTPPQPESAQSPIPITWMRCAAPEALDDMSFRWEEDLRNSFLTYSSETLWTSLVEVLNTRSLFESSCSQGRADLVWANAKCSWLDGVSDDAATLLMQPTCSRIMAALRPRAPRSEASLIERAGVGTTTFRRALVRLVAEGLVRDLGQGRYVLGSSFRFPDIEICSFEFKLENWKRAFQQAKRYRSFSHRVYVVMPSKKACRLGDALDVFRRFNIGLIGHDADGSSQKLLASKKQRPRSRVRFIQALGSLAQRDQLLNPILLANSDRALLHSGK
jgi:hypothetical protein